MTAITILAGIGYILSFLEHCSNGKININLILAAILVIATWSMLPLAITVICLTIIIGIVGAITN